MSTNLRRYDIDWLRVLAFYLLILFHVGMVFKPGWFHIKNPDTVSWIDGLMTWSNQWRLPLLFLISGAVIYYSLRKRSGGQFVKERFMRLLVPLIFGMLVVIPPQIYVERISNGVQYASYWEFWGTVFEFIPYPLGGSFSWHHLWYVVYIFVYSFAALPFILLFKEGKSVKVKKYIGNAVKKYPFLIYATCVPLYFFYLFLAESFPTTNALIDDWYKHSIYLTLFLFGYLASSIDEIWEAIVAKRRFSLIVGLGSGMFLMFFIWGENFDQLYENYSWFAYVYGVFKWLGIVPWLLAILGYGKKFLNKPSNALTYANDSVYPLFILHQSVELVFAYYIVQLDMGVLPKFILLVGATFGISLLLYEFTIKRFNITRILFGMKKKNAVIKFNIERKDQLESAYVTSNEN